MYFTIPTLPLENFIDTFIDFTTNHFAFLTKVVSNVLESGIDLLRTGLYFLPPWLIIIGLALIAWKLADRKVAIITVVGFLLIWNLRLWNATIDTLILVVISTAVAVAIGLPLGIWAALSPRFNRVIMPLLDLMQTMPAFVYLIPAIPFFGLGPVSAIFSTVIFAMPPAIRLTCFGIQQVPPDLVEAADAFGSSRSQKLFKLQLPLATPTIMTGINQTIMLSLSMVVIAAMIGAKGLGGEVWKAIQRLQPGKGFVAGIGVVIVAMVLDRISQKVGKQKYTTSGG